MGSLYGFNPTPSISLGDSERVIEITNELREARNNPRVTSAVDISAIVEKFVLDSPMLVKQASLGVETRPEFTVVEAPDNEDLIKIADERNKKAAELARLRAEIEEEEREARRLKEAREAARAEQERLLRLQEEENRKAAELLERQRQERIRQEQEAERLRAQQEAETKRRQDEIDRQLKLREQELARREQAIAEQERRKAEEAKAKAEADAREAERKANEARKKQLEAEIREAEEIKRKAAEAELQRKREQLAQLQKLKRQKEMEKEAAKAKAVQKPTSTSNSKIEYYSSLDINSLFKEVKAFADKQGLSRKIIDKKVLENQFGRANINKLILKSYLISIGKGVTFGNG